MRRNAFVFALAAAALAAMLSARPVRADETKVDLELILAVDISRSMDPD